MPPRPAIFPKHINFSRRCLYSHLIFPRSLRCCRCCCCCWCQVCSAVNARSRLASSFRVFGAYMASVATPVAPPHWGTTFGGFGAAAIATGSHRRTTTLLVGASTASGMLAPLNASSCPPSFPALPGWSVLPLAGRPSTGTAAPLPPVLPKFGDKHQASSGRTPRH